MLILSFFPLTQLGFKVFYNYLCARDYNWKTMNYFGYIMLLAAPLLGACSHDRSAVSDAPPAEAADIARLVWNYRGLDSLARQDSVERYRPEVEAFMKTVHCDSVTDEALVRWAGSRAVAAFTPPVDSVFPDIDGFRRDLGHILAAARADSLELPHRRYAAVVYGRQEAILFVDSVMLVALNHFLGREFEGYSHWPVYVRNTKTPENLPYAVAEALIGTAYPYQAEGDDATLLSRMLYEGAMAEARMRTVPGATVAGALGYNEEDMKWIDDNEARLWQELVESRLLYDTSAQVSDRFTAPAPTVRLLPTMWPGRIGRYTGYRIVRAYLDRYPDTSLRQLLSPKFYNSPDALALSEYSPK